MATRIFLAAAFGLALAAPLLRDASGAVPDSVGTVAPDADDQPFDPMDLPLDPMDLPLDPMDQPLDPMDLPLDPMDLPLDPMDLAADPMGVDQTTGFLPSDLYLEIFVNGYARRGIVGFRPRDDGDYSVDPEDLERAGLLATGASTDEDGRVLLSTLPDTTFLYDEAGQSMHLTAPDHRRVADVLDTGGARSAIAARDYDLAATESGWGAFANYSLFAAGGADRAMDGFGFEGASGTFDTYLYSPHGVVDAGFIVNTSSDGVYGSRRLGTSYTYDDREAMRQYRVGDLVTGGLTWTRPTRLGGVQIRRDFGLRPDLVTLPIPGLSSSAALPSTVDVYINGTQAYSTDVDPGPFRLANLPIVTGRGTARVVVRDASGRETVSESAFYTSDQLLAPGLFDYSAELGFGRTFYGQESFSYDSRPMGSGSVRYGFSETTTIEGHAEAGGGLINAGAGVVQAVGARSLVSLAASASRSDNGEGASAHLAVETQIGPARLRGRVQHSFGEYDDIASIIDQAARSDFGPLSVPLPTRPPRMSAQASISVPIPRSRGSVSLGYAQSETAGGERAQIVSFTWNQPVRKGSGTLYAAGFTDLARGQTSIYAGYTHAFGGGTSASLAGSGPDGARGAVSLNHNGGREIGSTSWALEAGMGVDDTVRAAGRIRHRTASAEYTASTSGGVDRATRADAQMDGAVVLAGEGLFFANRITDSFAIVDVGAPEVDVTHENRPVGRTGRNGKLLVSDLRAFQENRIAIDPSNLPINTSINATREIVVPGQRVGVNVRFEGAGASNAALVTFRDARGAVLPLGSSGQLDGRDEPFLVGYDGQSYVDGLTAQNHAVIELPTGERCEARFPFADLTGGAQAALPDVVCVPMA